MEWLLHAPGRLSLWFTHGASLPGLWRYHLWRMRAAARGLLGTQMRLEGTEICITCSLGGRQAYWEVRFAAKDCHTADSVLELFCSEFQEAQLLNTRASSASMSAGVRMGTSSSESIQV